MACVMSGPTSSFSRPISYGIKIGILRCEIEIKQALITTHSQQFQCADVDASPLHRGQHRLEISSAGIDANASNSRFLYTIPRPRARAFYPRDQGHRTRGLYRIERGARAARHSDAPNTDASPWILRFFSDRCTYVTHIRYNPRRGDPQNRARARARYSRPAR